MHIPTLIKYLVLAWGVPIAIVVLVRTFTPGANQERIDFFEQTFLPERVWVTEGRGRMGSDHFELRIQSPKGKVFFHRDPNREPILELKRRFPVNSPITVLYESSKLEGNVLMEIATADMTILGFDDIMAEYASRRRLVYIVAAVWCTLANLLSYALWKVDLSEECKPTKPEQGVALNA